MRRILTGAVGDLEAQLSLAEVIQASRYTSSAVAGETCEPGQGLPLSFASKLPHKTDS